MCGIAGIVMRNGRAADPAVLEAMARAMAHRGPDGVGTWLDGPVGLVSARLAIIDLVTGDQPLKEPGGAVLVANGEIYNDPELRTRLADAPYATGSDCESALQLYRREPAPLPEGLRGMYGLAICDGARVVLARDPFGIKPLYLVDRPDLLAFASEPQVLIAAGLAGSDILPGPRAELLQLKFITGRRTIFADIQRMLPGEQLVIEQGRIVGETRTPALPSGPRLAGDEDALLGQLDAVLTDSVAHHLRSDVPYGLFLSGGIDSSVLVALMSRITHQPIYALTAAFPVSAAADETALARRVAKSVGAEHHVVEMTEQDFWAIAPEVAACLDDPTTDAAALPTYLLAKAAKGHLKVVLSGEGADEIFGGYSRYRRAGLLGALAGRSRTRGVFRDAAARAPALAGWRRGLAAVEAGERRAGWSTMQRLQAIDCAEWLPNDLLTKLDRCLMAHSVEGRTPYLDPVVADFAFRLPDRMKVRGGLGKWLLRAWLAREVPAAEAMARKTGFVPPVGEWIAARADTTAALLACQPGVAEVFTPEQVKAVIAEAARRPQAAWSLLFYGLWHSRHVLGGRTGGTVEETLHAASALG